MRKIKYLKIDNNSDWLAYQRGLPKDIKGQAKAMHLPLTITRPLGLTKGASVAQITAAIETHNKVFDDVCRMLRSSSEGTVSKKQAIKNILQRFDTHLVTTQNMDPMSRFERNILGSFLLAAAQGGLDEQTDAESSQQ